MKARREGGFPLIGASFWKGSLGYIFTWTKEKSWEMSKSPCSSKIISPTQFPYRLRRHKGCFHWLTISCWYIFRIWSLIFMSLIILELAYLKKHLLPSSPIWSLHSDQDALLTIIYIYNGHSYIYECDTWWKLLPFSFCQQRSYAESKITSWQKGHFQPEMAHSGVSLL